MPLKIKQKDTNLENILALSITDKRLVYSTYNNFSKLKY